MDAPPVLYSLHNCPYAIRARIAILKAEQRVQIRSIKLDNKPPEMLVASPKGSVPVLVIQDEDVLLERVLDESLDIMVWALSQRDPNNLLRVESQDSLPAMLSFIESFETNFNPALNAYGCAKRYHEENEIELRQACESELAKLEQRLTQHTYLFSEQESLADIAVMPFLRKFARIDKQWFRECPYPKVRAWLNGYLQSPLFSKVMERKPLWLETREDCYFG